MRHRSHHKFLNDCLTFEFGKVGKNEIANQLRQNTQIAKDSLKILEGGVLTEAKTSFPDRGMVYGYMISKNLA
jgi:hypothetical protein